MLKHICHCRWHQRRERLIAVLLITRWKVLCMSWGAS